MQIIDLSGRDGTNIQGLGKIAAVTTVIDTVADDVLSCAGLPGEGGAAGEAILRSEKKDQQAKAERKLKDMVFMMDMVLIASAMPSLFALASLRSSLWL